MYETLWNMRLNMYADRGLQMRHMKIWNWILLMERWRMVNIYRNIWKRARANKCWYACEEDKLDEMKMLRRFWRYWKIWRPKQPFPHDWGFACPHAMRWLLLKQNDHTVEQTTTSYHWNHSLQLLQNSIRYNSYHVNEYAWSQTWKEIVRLLTINVCC